MFFREVIKDCEKEYQQESFEKGDSWKTMNIIDLHKKQEEEWNEYLDSKTLGDKYRELIDHILVSLMMAERFRSRIAKAQNPIIADKQNPQDDTFDRYSKALKEKHNKAD